MDCVNPFANDLQIEPDIVSQLRIPHSHFKHLSSTRLLCLVTNEWLQALVQGKINEHCSDARVQPSLCEQYFALSHSNLPEGWRRVTIKCVPKSTHLVDSLYDSALYNIRPDLSLRELLSYIAKENSRNVWQYCHTKYSGQSCTRETPAKKEMNEVMCTFLRRFHPYAIEDITDTDTPKITLGCNTRLMAIYNIVHIYSVYETQSHFYIIQPCLENSLQDVVSFSPAVLNTSHTKTLFVIFQLLHILRTFHERGLSVGDLHLCNIRVDTKLWLYLSIPCLKQIPYRNEHHNDDRISNYTNEPQQNSNVWCNNEIYAVPKTKASQYLSAAREVLKQFSYTKFHINDLCTVIEQWLNKELTNFKYLMILNHMAGRRMGDPNNHPVLPWVINFSSPDDDYRDFTLSKYRINKGDRQLDTTYETIAMAVSEQLEPIPNQIPHHISDMLSDITYYVYKARQTPKELLCKFVRSKWVPNEYPGSMQRMQEWTPDECIPEFFTDPALFVSIHDDLGDLDPPQWCHSPEEFVRRHIEALESDYVSERLHHWIDLTFGYKLSGEAAIRAKNVYLQLADNHCHITNHGVIQLFQSPHPYRVTQPHVLLPKSPKVAFDQASAISRPISDEDMGLSTKSRPPPSPDIPAREITTIALSPTYDPLAALHHLEATHSHIHSMSTTTASDPDTDSPPSNLARKNAMVSRDLQCLGCLILEMFYAPMLRLQPSDVPLRQRYLTLQKLYRNDRQRLPRPLRKAMDLLLPPTFPTPPEHQDDSLPLFTYDCVSDSGLPPPNPSLLLNLNTDVFPFPPCFPGLFECLCTLRMRDLSIEQNELSNEKSNAEKLKITKVLSREKVLVIEDFLRKHRMKLSREVIDILLPYIEELFSNELTAVQAAWHLFSLVAQALGPNETKRIFLPYFTKLLSGEDSTPKHMKLFHRIFLLQMITRLGLATFLRSFSTLLVEAVAGYKDFDISVEDEARTERVSDLAETTEEITDEMTTMEEGHRCSDHHAEPSNENDAFHDIEDATDALETVNLTYGNTRESSMYYDYQNRDNTKSNTQFDEDYDFPEDISLGDAEDNLRASSEFETISETSTENMIVGIPRERKDSDGQASLHSISHLIERSMTLKHTNEMRTQNGRSSSCNSTPEPDATFEADEGDNFDTQTPSEHNYIDSEDNDSKESLTPKKESPTSTLVENTDYFIERKNTVTENNQNISPSMLTIDQQPLDRADQDNISDVDDQNIPRTNLEDGISTQDQTDMIDETNETDETDDTEHGNDKDMKRESDTKQGIQPMTDNNYFRAIVRSETDEFNNLYTRQAAEKISNICDVAFNSVKWLSHRLGPLLAAKYMSRNLIRMMALCYLGPEQTDGLPDDDPFEMTSSKLIFGDKNASKVLDSLGVLVVLYGERMILSQYLPSIVDMVSVGQKRLTARTEASLIGCLVLTRHIIYYLSDKTLMDVLKDTITNEILLPLLRLVTSRVISFPSGAYVRSAICHKIIDVIYIVGLRIGFEMTRKHLTDLLVKFFTMFDALYAGAVSSPPVTTCNSPVIKTPGSSDTIEDCYLNIHMDSVTHEYRVGTPVSMAAIHRMSPRTGGGSQKGKHHTLTHTGSDETDDIAQGSISKEGILEELVAVFSPELAYCSYISFCRIFGSSHIEQNLRNDDIIRRLSAEHDHVLAQKSRANHNNNADVINSDIDAGGDGQDEEIRANVAAIGNKIELAAETTPANTDLSQVSKHYKATGLMHTNPETLLSPDMETNKHRHVRGNWLAYWEHELGLSERDNLFNFKQIKLQTFQGHQSSIRAMCVMDGENSFISASKDKTVRLWSLRNFSDGSAVLVYGHQSSIRAMCVMDGENSFISASKDKTVRLWSLRNFSDGSAVSKCQWVYLRHKKSVFSVAFVESYRQVASCDTSVHVWDPFTGMAVRQFESSRHNPVVAMVALPAPSTCILTALTTDSTLRLLDLRTGNYAQEYKCTTNSVGLLRNIAVSGDASWLVAGFSTGVVSAIDLNMGSVINTWKAHDSEVLQMGVFNKSSFVTSSFDQMKLWGVEDGRDLYTFKVSLGKASHVTISVDPAVGVGPPEPVHSFCFYRNQIVSATTANRIGVHSAVDANASYTSMRLRSDTFKGLVTCMKVLPLNRTLLLGADNGSIKLLC